MPNIPKYSRRKFQSTYVGGPQTDKSGSIIAGAVAEATAPILEQQTQKEEAKIQNTIDQQTNAALIEYGFTYQEKLEAMKKKYAANPDQIKAPAAEMGAALAETLGQGIPDERVRARFMGGANSTVKQSIAPLVNWTLAKQEENADIAVQESGRLINVSARNTFGPVALAGNIAAVDFTLDNAKQLSSTQREKLKTEWKENSIDTHFNNMKTNFPDEFSRMISRGEYKDMKYLKEDMTTGHVPISAKKLDKAETDARTISLAHRDKRDYDVMVNSAQETFDAYTSYAEGDSSKQSLYDKRDQMVRDKIPQVHIDGMNSVIRLANRRKTDPALLDEGVKAQAYSRWSSLSDKLELKKDEETGILQAAPELVTEMLEQKIWLANQVDMGKIEQSVYTSFNKEFYQPMFDAIQKQKGQGGFLWFKPDPNHKYYGVIGSATDNMAIPEPKKPLAKMQAFEGFMERVVDAQEQGVKLKDSEYRTFAQEAISDVEGSYFPRSRASVTNETANAVISQVNSVESVHSNPTDLKTGKSIGSGNKVMLYKGSIIKRNDEGKWEVQ